MKSRNANKLFFLLFLSVSTTSLVYSKLEHKELLENALQGTWQYFSIDKGGKSIAQFTNADTMVIETHKKSFWDNFRPSKSRSSNAINKATLKFSYKIPTLKKDAFGLVDLVSVPNDSCKLGIAFKFRYSNNSISSTGQTRIFNIDYWQNDTLVIREGAIYFRYIKRKSYLH